MNAGRGKSPEGSTTHPPPHIHSWGHWAKEGERLAQIHIPCWARAPPPASLSMPFPSGIIFCKATKSPFWPDPLSHSL